MNKPTRMVLRPVDRWCTHASSHGPAAHSARRACRHAGGLYWLAVDDARREFRQIAAECSETIAVFASRSEKKEADGRIGGETNPSPFYASLIQGLVGIARAKDVGCDGNRGRAICRRVPVR